MERYKYIIIDDEIPSQISLRHHFKQYKNYRCVATFVSPKKALVYLLKNQVDLIFLDIQMPEMSGFEFLEQLEKDIFTVLFTAYEEKHSLEAHKYYDKNLVNFTNKAQFKFFLPKIITRFEKMYKDKEIVERVNLLSKNEVRFFPQKSNSKAIPLTEIIYIEVIGHNIVLKIRNKEEEIFRMTMRELLDFLPTHVFFQIKRNIIINIDYVTAFSKTTVCIDDQHFIISKKNRFEIFSALKSQKQKLTENY